MEEPTTTGADNGGIPPVTQENEDIKEEDENEIQMQTEWVDVYLLAPEEDRHWVELKDFTIMKPKNNKMHRVMRFYPRCEITYRMMPNQPDREVVRPDGTIAPRHNGGFSNPSRNAEVFRLKRKLLSDYCQEMQHQGHANADRDEFESSFSHMEQYGSQMLPVYRPRPIPKYKRTVLEDAETIALTAEQTPKMSLKSRLKYITSLWPEPAPVSDEEDVMDYYGLEVEIISEEERQKELEAKKKEAKEKEESVVVASPVKSEKADDHDDGNASDLPDSPERQVETRSAAQQKKKEEEEGLQINPVASKQDDWVQCDKCQKWRRLPNHVNVSELPTIWYCKMNRWDKRYNKCSVPEEKVVMPMKESDLVSYRERRFAQDFLHRIKRMEKALQQYKYTDARDDSGERQVLQCAECLKQRPLMAGMDPSKIAQPFVCWMNNWDELHASCSAPQGAIPPHPLDQYGGPGGFADDANGKSVIETNGSSGDKKNKRKATSSSAGLSTPEKTTANGHSASNNNSKRPKRR